MRLSQGHPSTGWEPWRTGLTCLPLVYILIPFPAWPLRKISRRHPKAANGAVLNSNGAENSQDVREGRRRLPPTLPPHPPLNPSHCFLSIKALRDGFNVDGKRLLGDKRGRLSRRQSGVGLPTRGRASGPDGTCARSRQADWKERGAKPPRLPAAPAAPASPSRLLPPVFVRLVLLASVGVSRGLLRESGGSDSMCGC